MMDKEQLVGELIWRQLWPAEEMLAQNYECELDG